LALPIYSVPAAAGIYVLSLSLDKESTKENEQGALPLDPRRAAALCSPRFHARLKGFVWRDASILVTAVTKMGLVKWAHGFYEYRASRARNISLGGG
jgi:hypothetical protein